MFPRFSERRALPKAAEELESARIQQYWDDANALGREFKERVIPDFDGELAWDVWVLFDDEATWDSAGEHVVDWGSTVVATEERLFARLERVAER